MEFERQPMSNRFLWTIENIQEFFAKTFSLPLDLLLTKNRKDIDYRIFFLDEVVNHNIPIKQTKYYHFISDIDKGIARDAMLSSQSFLDLLEDIKQNGMKKPIIVGKFDSNTIKTRYIFKEKKFWFDFKNETGYQALSGAHRLAVLKFLGHSSVPVKKIKPLTYEITNYTEYIKFKEKQYEINTTDNI